MARAALVAAFGLELDHAQLRAALVAQHLGLDGHLGQVIAVHDVRAVDKQQRLQRNLAAVVHGQPLDEERLPLLDSVLLSTCFDDRVHGLQSLRLVG